MLRHLRICAPLGLLEVDDELQVFNARTLFQPSLDLLCRFTFGGETAIGDLVEVIDDLRGLFLKDMGGVSRPTRFPFGSLPFGL